MSFKLVFNLTIKKKTKTTQTEMENSSVVMLLTLSGLDFPLKYRSVVFVLTLLWYCLILIGNITIVSVIVVDKNLHEPMYIFLSNLCINSLYGTVGFYPKFLLDLLSTHVISHAGCMLQGYVIHSSVCADFTMLALMAYDRYVAICHPLTYHSFMSKQRISALVLVTWLVPLLSMFMNTATLLGSRLCGSYINKVYCVNWMMVKLACASPPGNAAVTYFNICLYCVLLVFIVWTYVRLIRTCLVSLENQRRFMNTCVPHLISLFTFSVSVLLDVLYMRFGSVDISMDLNNFMAMEFLIIPPAVNPLLYGFKLAKIRRTIINVVLIRRKPAVCALQGSKP